MFKKRSKILFIANIIATIYFLYTLYKINIPGLLSNSGQEIAISSMNIYNNSYYLIFTCFWRYLWLARILPPLTGIYNDRLHHVLYSGLCIPFRKRFSFVTSNNLNWSKLCLPKNDKRKTKTSNAKSIVWCKNYPKHQIYGFFISSKISN